MWRIKQDFKKGLCETSEIGESEIGEIIFHFHGRPSPKANAAYYATLALGDGSPWIYRVGNWVYMGYFDAWNSALNSASPKTLYACHLLSRVRLLWCRPGCTTSPAPGPDPAPERVISGPRRRLINARYFS